MGGKRKLKKSRDSWKGKAVGRGGEARRLRKENRRLAQERDRYKAIVAQMKAERERMNVVPACQTKEDLVYLTLKLYRDARLGFRAVSRVLDVLSEVLGFDVKACAQTIINWVARLAIVRVRFYVPCASDTNGPDPFSNGTIWLVDVSIALSSAKILTIIAINVRHHAEHDGAPTLLDYRCVAVAVAESWTGEIEADFMERVIEVTGRPSAMLMDGGTDLGKSNRDLAAKEILIPVVEDVSHFVANLLKHEYEDHASFDPFMSACGKASKKLKQTVLAFLAPPKISMKARFMNIHRLVQWADKILKHSPQGRAAKGSILEKLRGALNEIPEHKLFITNFLRDAVPPMECMKLLKNKGLSHETWAQCQKLVEAIPATSSIRTGFIEWGERMMLVANKLGVDNIGMPVSTDGLECLFSVGKRHGSGEIKDANRIALRLPVECGPITHEDAKRVLGVTVAEQNEIIGGLPSLLRQRCRILPNPGALSELILDPGKHLELIPQPKTREKSPLKSPNIIDISVVCRNEPCVRFGLEESAANMGNSVARGAPMAG